MRGQRTWWWWAAVVAALALAGCRSRTPPAAQAPARTTAQTSGSSAPSAAPPQSLAMGGAKSRMTFFITSAGMGKGGDLGGLAGADRHCQALATKEGAGDHTWRAYLSTTATATDPAVNARDRIGAGPWYDAEAELVAANVADLHDAAKRRVSRDTALTEKGDTLDDVLGAGREHDVLTGSQADGTAFAAGDDRTCGNWTSSSRGRAQVGRPDGPAGTLWNSAHPSTGCSEQALGTGSRSALFSCFAID